MLLQELNKQNKTEKLAVDEPNWRVKEHHKKPLVSLET